MNFDELDSQMRSYEQSIDKLLPADVLMLARLDGRSFTRLTKELCQFERPFDVRFRDMMTETVKQLMDCGFRVIYGFTESDEISLLFHPQEHAFGRKLRKYNSILAGVASAAFSLQLGQPGIFDCRMVPLPTLERVVDYFLWRQEDAHRNALNAHCYWLLRKQGAPAQQATEQVSALAFEGKHELLRGYGVDFDALPAWQKWGVGVWHSAHEREGLNPVTHEKTITVRRELSVEYQLPRGTAYAALIQRLLRGDKF